MQVLDSYPWIADVPGIRPRGRFFDATCPVCGGLRKLTFTVGESGNLSFGCWRGCSKLEILRSLGKTWRDTFVSGIVPERPKQSIAAVYKYRRADGRLLFEVVRLEPGCGGRDKEFRQRRYLPDGIAVWGLTSGHYGFRRLPSGRISRSMTRCCPDDSGFVGIRHLPDAPLLLYNLPAIVSSPSNETVYIVGGEKDADTLTSLGFLATTNPGGESRPWPSDYSQFLAGRHVVMIDDDDPVGHRHGDEVSGSLIRHHVASLRRVVLPCKDASEYIHRLRRLGFERREMIQLFTDCILRSPEWKQI